MYYVLCMKVPMINRVILTIAAVALFVVPVSIITLQSSTNKTVEASHYSNCSVVYYSSITNSYSSCTPVKSSANNKNTNNTTYTSTDYQYYSYPYSYTSNYGTYPYNCSNYCYDSASYSYNNSGNYGSYIYEPYVDIKVNQPNYSNYKIKNSDSQQYKDSYCQNKYSSTDYIFINYYCVS